MSIEWVLVSMTVLAIVALGVGHRVGREAERAEPSGTDDELIRWIVRRRMINRVQRDLERAQWESIEREVARRESHGDGWMK